MNGYSAIFANNKDANNFCIIWFTPVIYTLQEDVESDGNALGSSDPVCNSVYRSTGCSISSFYVDQFERQKSMIASTRTVATPNIDIKICTQKI